MTKEERQLLLKDLSARLPYGVKCLRSSWNYEWDQEISVVEVLENIDKFGYIDYHKVYKVDDIKPYLRPMSSMTEEEEREVVKLGVCYDGAFHNDIYDVGTSMEEAFTAISWLLERHFDINYLIQKGLALEAPEDMYKIN